MQRDDALGERPLDARRGGLEARRAEAPLDAEDGLDRRRTLASRPTCTPRAGGRTLGQATADGEKHGGKRAGSISTAALLPAARVAHAHRPAVELRPELDDHPGDDVGERHPRRRELERPEVVERALQELLEVADRVGRASARPCASLQWSARFSWRNSAQ